MISDLLSFINRKIYPGFKIPKGDIVIDIGSGDKPFWRADVFYDNLSLGDIQRVTKSQTIQDIGYFVDGDISKMPFKDKAFDFSLCNHLLEHVERPDLAIKEITRISKGGYIESPNGILELIKPHPAHLWFMFLINGKLLFIRKSKIMHRILTENSRIYEYLLSQTREPFIRLYWKKGIQFEIIDNLKDSERHYPNEKMAKKHQIESSAPYYLLMVRILRRLFYTEKDIKRLEQLKHHPRK